VHVGVHVGLLLGEEIVMKSVVQYFYTSLCLEAVFNFRFDDYQKPALHAGFAHPHGGILVGCCCSPV
jgi:uncharacterized membrane protein